MRPETIHLTTLDSEDELVEGLSSGAPLTVGQIYRPDILVCGPELSVSEAAQRMSDAGSSAIIIVEDDEAIGIWTERDTIALDLTDPQTFSLPIRSVMSAPVKTVLPTAAVNEVTLRFREEHLRHLLVVDSDGNRLGLLSQTEVVLNQGVEHYMRLRPVKSVAPPKLVVLDEDARASEAAGLMRREGRDAIVVVYADGSHGILTERDLVRLVGRKQEQPRIGDLASRPLICIDEESSLYRTRSMLLESKIRHLGVLRQQDLVGLVSFSDIVSGMELAYVQELRVALEERNRALRLSRHSLRLAEKIIESSPEGIMITNQQGHIISVNPAFSRLTGYSEQEVLGQPPSVLSSGRHGPDFYKEMWAQLRSEGHWQGEIWNRRKSGEVYPELLTITQITDEQGELSHFAALFSDISQLKENEDRIRHLAYYDPLTGLPNRRLFSDRLSMALAHAHRSKRQLAVMFVDLDRFKRVNDSLGHGTGDQLLQAIAVRIRECTREDDTVARMGGDEFILLLSEIAGMDEAVQVARRIIDTVTRPVHIDGDELVVTCSIGISFYPEDGLNEEALIKNADTAMYRAKDAGRNGYELYTPTMNALSLEHLAMEVGLRKALERDEFQVYYQPLIDVKSGLLAGAEALLRWQHPDLGLVPPADFIPLAEETGLVLPMGNWVLAEVCRQIKQWQQQGFGSVRVGVNISARQFGEPHFLDGIRSLLRDEELEASLLHLEMTETLLMEDGVEVIRQLQLLREMGIGVSVDDFGTGYSSLSYLKRFPIDILKIDRSFVRDMHINHDDAAIVSSIINLAHSLGLSVVAEGVEEQAQFEMLKEQGCDVVQGFLYSRPLPLEEFQRQFLKL